MPGYNNYRYLTGAAGTAKITDQSCRVTGLVFPEEYVGGGVKILTVTGTLSTEMLAIPQGTVVSNTWPLDIRINDSLQIARLGSQPVGVNFEAY